MKTFDTRKTGFPMFFQEVPNLGTKVKYWGGHVAELIAIEPYTNKAGKPSQILSWRFDDGRIGTTGLRSKAVIWRAQ